VREKENVMRKVLFIFIALSLLAAPAYANDIAEKLNAVLMKAQAEGNWQIPASEIAKWIKEKRTDFLIVDVRANPQEYKNGHIPGAIHIPHTQVLQPENLKKLPKDKKIVLVCVTGQTQNLPIVPLRALGYDAHTMKFGHASWIKGYFGGRLMQGAIAGAAKNNYPLVK
jgi:rhodanese-related sulfurtransferase